MEHMTRRLLVVALLAAMLLSCEIGQDPTTKLPRVEPKANYETWETPEVYYTPVPTPTPQ